MSTSVANSRVQLSRDELHQLRWLLGLVLVLLAYWTLFSLDAVNLVELVAITVAVAVALLFPAWPGLVPRGLWGWFLPVGAFILLAQMALGNFDMLSSLVLLVSLLTLYRSLQYRRRREDWQLVLLCLFIIVLSGVLTLSMLFGLQILIFTVVTMALLFVMNLLERDSARALTRADWKNFHWRRFLGRLYHALDLRLLMLAFGLFTLLVGVGTVIFIVMPRYHFEQAFSFGRLRGVSGFQEDIDYGDGSKPRTMSQDNSLALSVDVPDGVVFTSPPYWRMIVLDEYFNNTFRSSSLINRAAADKVTRYTEANPRHAKRGPHGKWTFYLEGNVSEYLPILGAFDSLTFSSPQDFRHIPEVLVYRTDTPSPNVLGYEIEDMDTGDLIAASWRESSADLTLAGVEKERAGLAELHASTDQSGTRSTIRLPYPYTYMGLPDNEDDQAYLRQTAQTIRGDNMHMAADEFCKAATHYLQENHSAADEVNVTPEPGHASLVAWMKSKQGGWCEYFAGSLTLLARAAGYPARVAAGFKGATYNASAGSYLIRESDAHAWVEVYNEQGYWQREDPTPSASFIVTDAPGGAASGIPSETGWGARLDSLRILWYRRVINFDQADQLAIADKFTQWTKNLGTVFRDWLLSIKDSIGRWFAGPVTPTRIASIGSIALVLLLVLRWRLRIRNWWLRASGRGVLARINVLAPVRRDAGRWLLRFQPVWQLKAKTLTAIERARWESVRLDLLMLRYGPLESIPNPAGTFQRARRLLKSRKA